MSTFYIEAKETCLKNEDVITMERVIKNRTLEYSVMLKVVEKRLEKCNGTKQLH